MTHPGEHLHVSEAHLSRVWPVPAGACFPDAPGGLLVGQTLHLNTNKQSEGSRCLSLDWEFILVLSRTGGGGAGGRGHHKVRKEGGEKPSCLCPLPARGRRMTCGELVILTTKRGPPLHHKPACPWFLPAVPHTCLTSGTHRSQQQK